MKRVVFDFEPADTDARVEIWASEGSVALLVMVVCCLICGRLVAVCNGQERRRTAGTTRGMCWEGARFQFALSAMSGRHVFVLATIRDCQTPWRSPSRSCDYAFLSVALVETGLCARASSRSPPVASSACPTSLDHRPSTTPSALSHTLVVASMNFRDRSQGLSSPHH